MKPFSKHLREIMDNVYFHFQLSPKFFAYMNPVNLHLSIAYQKDFRARRASGEPYDGYVVVTLKSESGEPLDTVRLGMSFQVSFYVQPTIYMQSP